jgi:hypothetical protein
VLVLTNGANSSKSKHKPVLLNLFVLLSYYTVVIEAFSKDYLQHFHSGHFP